MYTVKPPFSFLIYHYKTTVSYCSKTRRKWMNIDTEESGHINMKHGQVIDMYVYCYKDTAVVYSQLEFLDEETGYHYYDLYEGDIVINPEEYYNDIVTKTIHNPVDVVYNKTKDFWLTDNAENQYMYETK